MIPERITVPVDRVIKAEMDYTMPGYYILMSPGEGLAPTDIVFIYGDEALQEMLDHWEKTGRVKVRVGFPRLLSNGQTEWDYDEYEPHGILVTEALHCYFKRTGYEEVTSDEWKKRQAAKVIVKSLRRDPEPVVRRV